MRIYLVRHGNAVEKIIDPKRPLSDLGRRQIGKIVSIIKSQNLQVDVILHSEKLRAAQTAAILSSAFQSIKGILEIPGLAPLDSIFPISERIGQEEKDMVIAGHLPFLDRLVSLLVNGDDKREILSFPEGGMTCLECGLDKKWRLLWFFDPELIP